MDYSFEQNKQNSYAALMYLLYVNLQNFTDDFWGAYPLTQSWQKKTVTITTLNFKLCVQKKI